MNFELPFILAVKLFAIMDPLSILPFLLSLHEEFNRNSQTKIPWSLLVKKIGVAVTGLMLVFSVLGRPMLYYLGLSVSSLEIGGGLILIYLGVDTLGGFQQLKFMSSRIEEAVVTPIATPLLVGPGAMSALVTLGVTNGVLTVILSSLIASALVFAVLAIGPLIVKVMGNTGTVAAGRFVAIIIAAFGVQLIINGISQIKLT
ncbi:MarC family protein [Sulfuracidifex metallicus]|uniref:MarC family protein n=1 Tax=Sulfuracidifex metallicus TaxID=47303 RepID=UPI002273545F|nr:MarC family protein [Sulfuracidifex metallicus]MCY0849932.1 MarC family protein [Sulfuracidifex metallicus]